MWGVDGLYILRFTGLKCRAGIDYALVMRNTMSQAHWLRGVIAVLLGGMLLFVALGCNEESNFDPSELFSIEDYAQDQDYALNFIQMMDSWHKSTKEAKGFLETNVEGLTFLEYQPDYWQNVDPSSRSYIWSTLFMLDPNGSGDPNDPFAYIPADDDAQLFNSDWWFRSYQDVEYKLIALDRSVSQTAAYAPAEISLMNLVFQANPYGGSFAMGDSVSVWYTDDFSNPSALEGSSMFWNRSLVQAQEAPTDIASYANMSNAWGGTMTNLHPDPNNPQCEFDVSGVSVLVRADLVETATLGVSIEASIRSNGRGEGVVYVDGEKRTEIVFEYYDTAYHGYYKLSKTGFQENVRF
ncbi:hypothetical protein BMS3Bbin04_01526 [bacterium BMS3Bbin04]|nr:hypothetical protein BMS3Bbin04_01526 [bacterium BMS3Bbin04]